MTPTIELLLATPALKLRLLPEGGEHSAEVRRRLRHPLSWVHGSDLVDPTPFLSVDNLLLTDGAQFGFGDDADQFDYDAYIRRLIDAGIVGLGFATEFLHVGAPAGLVRACVDLDFPLIDVPDRVPFIAIIRRVADELTAEQNARLEWSLGAQKAISRAALTPNGMQSILLELEAQLDCWVRLYDSLGTAVIVHGQRAVPADLADAVAIAARAALSRASRSGTTVTVGRDRVTMQTLGQRGQLRGVLALGRGAPLDKVENELVTSVIALASLALEQNRALDTARTLLRSGLLELMIDGRADVAGRTAGQLWGRLPGAPVTALVVADASRSQQVLDSLELFCEERAGGAFFAVRDGDIVVLAESGVEREVVALLDGLGHRIGVAKPVGYRALAEGIEQARLALDNAHAGIAVSRFDEIMEQGMLGFLRAGRAEPVAREVVAPLIEFDRRNSTELVRSLRVWFANDCSWERASRQLGLHRHTLRNRVDQAGGILNLDLDGLSGRMELWTALQLVPAS